MKRFGLVVALGLVLGCLGGCKGKELENLEIVDGHEMINQEILINETNFPDEIFRKYVADNYDKDANGRLSGEEKSVRVEFDLSGMGISDLKGIECFLGILRLRCQDNQLTELDLSKNTLLSYVECSRNKLEKLIIRANKVNILLCDDNRLKELDLSGLPELELVDCSNNQLTELNLSNCRNEVNVTADEGVNIIRPTKAEE